MLKDTMEEGIQWVIVAGAVAVIVAAGVAIMWWLGGDDYELCRSEGFSAWYCYRLIWG